VNRPLERAFLVAVGDELLAGAHMDLNSPELARNLARLGIAVQGVEIASDDEQAIARAVARGRERAELVLVTGGLGPTLDDVTRHGVARALSRGLVPSPEARADLELWYARRGTPMPAANLRQTLLPEGAERVRNRVGTAPGFLVEDERGIVAVLPGPPQEMRVVFCEEIEPWLRARRLVGDALAERHFHLFGLSESAFAGEAGDWMERDASPRMGCAVKDGVLSVVLRARVERPRAHQELAERERAFRERFAAHVFSEDDPALESVLVKELLARGVRVTLAESCTGGLAAALLTRIPGVSAVFERGFVVYADRAKEELLSVPRELLARHGAVSRQVVEAMAQGALAASGADLALAVTGIAGPTGGSAEKPVGLMWFATCLRGDLRSEMRRLPPFQREWIQNGAARMALFLGLRRLRGLD